MPCRYLTFYSNFAMLNTVTFFPQDVLLKRKQFHLLTQNLPKAHIKFNNITGSVGKTVSYHVNISADMFSPQNIML